MALVDFPGDRSLVGVGLSDAVLYAVPLAEKVDYLNTYYHTEPYLDITDIPAELERTLDFMISSDVFEHVPPPAARAFDGAYRTLKPGGHLLLTVPFTNDDETVEHFPELHEFEIYGLPGRPGAGQPQPVGSSVGPRGPRLPRGRRRHAGDAGVRSGRAGP